MFQRQLVSKMIEMEVKHSGSDIQENFSNIVKIGGVNVATPNRQFSLDLMVSKCESETPFSLLEFVDQTVAVCLDLKGFDLFFSPSMKDLADASIAHEIGHYLAGHLSNVAIARNMNICTGSGAEEKQNRCYDNGDYNSYMRSLMVSLLRGDVLKYEYEADLIALNFVNATSLVAAHALYLSNTNKVTVLEKVNRINKILKASETIKPNREKYYIEYTLKGETFV